MRLEQTRRKKLLVCSFLFEDHPYARMANHRLADSTSTLTLAMEKAVFPFVQSIIGVITSQCIVCIPR